MKRFTKQELCDIIEVVTGLMVDHVSAPSVGEDASFKLGVLNGYRNIIDYAEDQIGWSQD